MSSNGRSRLLPLAAAFLAARATSFTCSAFHLQSTPSTISRAEPAATAIAAAAAAALDAAQAPRRKKCGYQTASGRWEQRRELAELNVGEKLLGRKVDGCDLLDGKTGPKIFFECGVGRIDSQGRWHIVNGMLRLGRRGARKSVTAKRVQRLTDTDVELYVTRVDTATGVLEVSTSGEMAEEAARERKKVSASSLKVGDELVGTVVRVEDYGVLVDVGANRLGLLHIQKVANLFQRYIKKAEGLEDCGLERGAQITVAVSSNEKKRLFLDFTTSTKKEVEKERLNEEEERVQKEKEKEKVEEEKETTAEAAYDIAADEAAAWAAYGAGNDADDDGMADAADWEAFAAASDTYDEDDDIEDALGIGSY